MNKIELERKLQAEGLMTIYDDGVKKRYIDGESIIKNGIRQNAVNVFGLYRGQKDYVVFITDEERGLPCFLEKHSTESGACEALYDYLILLKRIHEKSKANITLD